MPELNWDSIKLESLNCRWYSRGKPALVVNLWLVLGKPILRILPCETGLEKWINQFKIFMLRLFGAKIGKNCVIRSCDIHFPWNLIIGDHVWIGYNANLYSLAKIRIGNNVCVSQNAFLCTGTHDAEDPGFGLKIGEITLKDGSWICANCFVGPGVIVNEGAVAGAGSVVLKDLPPMMICAGNPCLPVKKRILR